MKLRKLFFDTIEKSKGVNVFSLGHCIWIGISMVLIAGGLLYCLRTRPELDRMIRVCFVLALVSECVKVFSVMKIVPMVNPVITEQNGLMVISYVPSGEYTPMMGLEHLPLELCSLQILFMGLCCVIRDETKKHILYAIMYPTGVIGALLGIVMATVTAYIHTPAEYFLSARVWQYFLFHSMVVCLSIYG